MISLTLHSKLHEKAKPVGCCRFLALYDTTPGASLDAALGKSTKPGPNLHCAVESLRQDRDDAVRVAGHDLLTQQRHGAAALHRAEDGKATSNGAKMSMDR